MTHASFKSKRKKASQEFWDLLKTESHWFGVSHVVLPEPIIMSREIERQISHICHSIHSPMELGWGWGQPIQSTWAGSGRRIDVKGNSGGGGRGLVTKEGRLDIRQVKIIDINFSSH